MSNNGACTRNFKIKTLDLSYFTEVVSSFDLFYFVYKTENIMEKRM